MDDPEFLTRSSPTRKRSEDEIGCSTTNTIRTDDVDAGAASKMSKIEGTAEPQSDQLSEGVPGSADPDFKSSTPFAATTNLNSTQTAESLQIFRTKLL